MSQSIRKRAEIPVEDTWNLADLYVTDAAWEEDLELLKKDGQVLASYKDRLGQAEELFAYLSAMEKADDRADRLAN